MSASTSDLGIYIQDSWRLNRLTANVGLRWETLNAKVLAGKSPAGRFVPERTFEEIEDVPDWNDFAPRMALVYDLMGNGRTARQVLAEPLQPVAHDGHRRQLQPAAVADGHAAVARRERQRHRRRASCGCTGYPSVGCEIRLHRPVVELRHRAR